MATHDYVIANQSGASFRTDLNNALAAIVSNNSNSSSPSTTYAYQWWADTSNNVLKIRNSANNAWIELLQLDGTLTLEDGAVGTPALAFRDDLNTGIFSSGEDTFNIATAGVEKLRITNSAIIFNEDGNNVDFRIEGDSNANLFFLDAGNDRIGIGTNSPSQRLSVSAGHVNIDSGYSYQWGDSHERIAQSDGKIEFFTNNTQKMTLSGSNLGISKTNPSARLDIGGLTNTGGENTDALIITRTDGLQLFGINWNVDANEVSFSGNTKNYVFKNKSSSAESIRFPSTGGITFNGDTAAANALDDYEEGTWSGLLNGGNFTATQTNFVYTKIGRKVTVNGTMTGFSSSTNSSNIELTGIPFSTESGISFAGSAFFSKLNKYSGYGNAQGCRVEEGSNRIVFMYPGQGGNAQFAVRYTDLNNTSDSRIQFTATYFTAS